MVARRRAAIEEAEAAREALEEVWDRVSLALPRRTDPCALVYSERAEEGVAVALPTAVQRHGRIDIADRSGLEPNGSYC